jgi:hypothetical protein
MLAIEMPEIIEPTIPRYPWSVPQRKRFPRFVVPCQRLRGAP